MRSNHARFTNEDFDMENTEVLTADDETGERFLEAYNVALPDMLALKESELAHLNLDIPSAVTTTLGAWKEISQFRDQVSRLPDFDVASFDKLETYARAAWHAHSLFLAASEPAVPLQALGDKAVVARQTLLSDATALAHRGLVDGERLKDLKGPIGYKNVAVDIGMLVALLRERWTALEGKTPLTTAELNQANALAEKLVTAVGVREQAPVVVAAATDRRVRAYSLLLKTYDEARRAVAFLRWKKQDVDAIAPSLYAGRQNANHRGRDAAGRPGEPTTTAATSTKEPGTVVTAPAAPRPSAPASTQVAVGFPGSDPFGK
jgi:hypothetical protein